VNNAQDGFASFRAIKVAELLTSQALESRTLIDRVN